MTHEGSQLLSVLGEDQGVEMAGHHRDVDHRHVVEPLGTTQHSDHGLVDAAAGIGSQQVAMKTAEEERLRELVTTGLLAPRTGKTLTVRRKAIRISGPTLSETIIEDREDRS